VIRKKSKDFTINNFKSSRMDIPEKNEGKTVILGGRNMRISLARAINKDEGFYYST